MLERILWFVTALILVAFAFFFLAAAIVIGAVVGAVLIARVWWVQRRIRKAAEKQILTAEYSIIERESPAQARLPDGLARTPSQQSGGATDPEKDALPPA